MKYHIKRPNYPETSITQASLVAYLDSRHAILEKLISHCTSKLTKSNIAPLLVTFPINEIHATIIGLESFQESNRLYNTNSWLDLQKKKEMNFEAFMKIISGFFPMTIRFGGFNRSFNEFMSWGSIPYERSFQLLYPAGDFTLVGWPHDNGDFESKSLWNLREQIELDCNIRHKYSNHEDNDFFLRIAQINGEWQRAFQNENRLEDQIHGLEDEVRDYLLGNPIDVKITLNDVYLITYRIQSSKLKIVDSFRVADGKINGQFIDGLVRHMGG